MNNSHPFPTLARRSREGGGLFIGNSYWRDAEMGHVTSMQELIMLCGQMGIRIEIQPVIGDAKISRSRNRAASLFLRSKMDVLATIDGDVEFAPYQLLRMVEEAYEHSLVGGAYVKRNGHKPGLAIRLLSDAGRITFAEGEPLVEVDYLVTGFLATHRRVFEKIIADNKMEMMHQSNAEDFRWYPVFNDYVVEKHGRERFDLSEDWAFLQRAKDSGFKNWLDPRVRLRHWGVYDFTLEDAVRPPREEPGIVVWDYNEGRERVGYAPQPIVWMAKDNFKIHLIPGDAGVSGEIRRTGVWEEPVRDAILKHLKPDWTFLDLGANIGYFSLLAASMGNRVIAVEPNPVALSYFKASIAENHFEELIELHEVAVSNANRKYTLITSGLRNQGEAYLTALQGNDHSGPVVQTATLGNVLGDCRPEMIKMDIEGEEWNVIKSAPEVIQSAKVVLIEISDDQLRRNSQSSEIEVLGWLADHGFSLEQISDHKTYADWIAIRE